MANWVLEDKAVVMASALEAAEQARMDAYYSPWRTRSDGGVGTSLAGFQPKTQAQRNWMAAQFTAPAAGPNNDATTARSATVADQAFAAADNQPGEVTGPRSSCRRKSSFEIDVALFASTPDPAAQGRIMGLRYPCQAESNLDDSVLSDSGVWAGDLTPESSPAKCERSPAKCERYAVADAAELVALKQPHPYEHDADDVQPDGTHAKPTPDDVEASLEVVQMLAAGPPMVPPARRSRVSTDSGIHSNRSSDVAPGLADTEEEPWSASDPDVYLTPSRPTTIAGMAAALDIDVVTVPQVPPSPPGLPGHAMAMAVAAGGKAVPLKKLTQPSTGGSCSPVLGRRQAESRLLAAGPDRGTFLFRQGTNGKTVLTLSDGSKIHHLVVNDKKGVPVSKFDERQWKAFVGHYKESRGELPSTLTRFVLG